MRHQLASIAGALALLAASGGFSAAPVMAQSATGTDGTSAETGRRVPYEEFHVRTCPASRGGDTTCQIAFPVVPQGKRLILQRVNAAIHFATGGIRSTVLYHVTETSTGQTSVIPFFLIPHPMPDQDLVVVNEPVLAFLEAGQEPVFQLIFSDPDDVPIVSAVLSGYLVDVEP